MYVKTTNGEAGKYTLAQLRADNPNVSFPNPLPDEVAARWDVYPLTASPQPEFDPLSETVVEDAPRSIGGIWTQTWRVEELGEDVAAGNIRRRRDQLLEACDWVVIRARELGQTVPGPWLAFRGDLRKVPEQPGFPFDVIWPTPPV